MVGTASSGFDIVSELYYARANSEDIYGVRALVFMGERVARRAFERVGGPVGREALNAMGVREGLDWRLSPPPRTVCIPNAE